MTFLPHLRYVSKTTYYRKETVVARDCRILYVIAGHGSFECDGEIFELTAHTLIYYPYGLPYRIRSDTEERMLFYTLNFDFSQEYREAETMVPIPWEQGRQADWLYSIPQELEGVFGRGICLKNAFWAEPELERIYAELLEQKTGCGRMQDALLQILLIKLYRSCRQEGRDNAVCRKIKDAIRENPKANIKELALLLNYHPFYLNEVFRKNEKMTIHDYLTRQRLIMAKELITTSQMTLEEIAQICGFSSQSHLSGVFRRYYHITPGYLRRNL